METTKTGRQLGQLAIAAERRSSTNAPALLQRLSSHRGDVTLWLGDHTSAAGLRAFLAAAEDADGQCLAWTETA